MILANIEFDHADIFASLEEYALSFRRLMNCIPGNGFLVTNDADPLVRETAAFCRGRVLPVLPGGPAAFSFPLPGEHYLTDARLAATAAAELGLSTEEIARGMATYRGVKRRLEVVLEAGGVTLYDDFAHHPTAIRLDLETLRAKHPDARIFALFEPRSNTLRRRVFQEALPAAFAGADEVVIGAVHRSEKLDAHERLDPAQLARDCAAAGRRARHLPDVDAILDAVLAEVRPGDVVAVLSNGSFGGLIPRLNAGLCAWAVARR